MGEDDMDNIQESEDAIFDINESLKERAQSEHEQDIENGQIGPRHIRSKSVPATPNFSELEKSPFDNVQSLSLNESEQKTKNKVVEYGQYGSFATSNRGSKTCTNARKEEEIKKTQKTSIPNVGG